MAKRKSKREKQVEAAAEAAFKKVGSSRIFSIMDLGKIQDAGIQAAGTEGEINVAAIEAAVSAACDKFEIKK